MEFSAVQLFLVPCKPPSLPLLSPASAWCPSSGRGAMGMGSLLAWGFVLTNPVARMLCSGLPAGGAVAPVARQLSMPLALLTCQLGSARSSCHTRVHFSLHSQFP